MTPDMMVIVDYDGKKLAGDRDASSELPMHLEIYRNRPDVNAVVHAHPPIATGFAVAGIPLTRAVLAEVITTLGSIPIAEYGTPSTARTAGGRAEVHQGARRHAAGQSRRRDLRHRRDGGVLQDGDDRALREDQPRGAAARRREPAFRARRSSGCRGCAACTASRRRRRCARTRTCRRPPDQVLCQVLEAPESATERLVPTSRCMPAPRYADSAACRRRAARWRRRAGTGKFG